MNYKRLIVSLALPQLAGIAGSLFTVSAIPDWYANLQKPLLSPPNWVFGSVWTLLYILMGVSVYLVWQRVGDSKKDRRVLWLFWIHLFFNALWSVIFFGLHNPGAALVNLIIIWLFVIVLISKFWRVRKLSSCLLIPYLLWVSFAGYLNYHIWILNR